MDAPAVEPVNPGRRSRVRALAAAAVPLVLLASVIGVGLLDADGSRKPVLDDNPRWIGTAAPVGTAHPEDAAETVFPANVLGISTVDADAVTRLARAGISSDRLVAVAGWLAVSPESAECQSAWELCRRIGLLSDVPTVDGGGALFLETRPDAVVTGTESANRRPDAWSVPSVAVVVGRFAPRVDRECGLRRPFCERVFTVEWLAWLDGSGGSDGSDGPQVVPDAVNGASMTRSEAAATGRQAIRGAGELVGATLLERSRLASVEPDAAVVAARGDGRVWLVRAVAFRPREDNWYEPIAGWAIVDDTTGQVIAATPSRDAPGGRQP